PRLRHCARPGAGEPRIPSPPRFLAATAIRRGNSGDDVTPPLRILELRSVWGTGGGPDKTILAGSRLSDRTRFHTSVCYVRDARDRTFALDKRAAELGVDYV